MSDNDDKTVPLDAVAADGNANAAADATAGAADAAAAADATAGAADAAAAAGAAADADAATAGAPADANAAVTDASATDDVVTDDVVADASDTEVLDAAAGTVEADTATMGAPRTGSRVSDTREATATAPTAPTPPWSITITTDASSAGTGAAATHYGRPRTRWAAIVWGLIIAGIAATTLAIVGSPARRLALSDWASTLTPGAFWILSVLVVGVFILLLAVLALIRRAQRRRLAA